MHLEYTYRDRLSGIFYNQQSPVSVDDPEMVCFNEALAKEINLRNELGNSETAIDFLSGKKVLKNTFPIAQAYAGHQFGQFTMLGDGRAVLLGEHVFEGNRWDIQLKGSGITKYSRRGDGRATFTSMLREYLMSEAMHHLGIKTTRSLAVVKTGEPVHRERVNEGAVLTRIAESHIRVGTFEYARFYTNELESFTKYVIGRHDSDLLESENYALDFLSSVMNRQIELIVNWMRVGFIHGVMNTDNMSIAGETIDYGPCAFMNTYHPKTVFSSIDRQGRYAYDNQPYITHWNLSILANAILPLINGEEKKAIEMAESVLHTFPERYQDEYYKMMLHKIGILNQRKEDRILIKDMLVLMQKHQLDYTNFFVSLRYNSFDDKLMQDVEFKNWYELRDKAVQRSDDSKSNFELMDKNNPVVIPRNHIVEDALDHAVNGNMKPFETLMDKLSNPYQEQETQKVLEGFDQSYQTFCGT